MISKFAIQILRKMNLLEVIWSDIVSNDVTVIGSIFKLVLSLILGSIVGFERKSKGQIAGDRTFALISMGATLAMLLSIYIPQEYLGLKNGDPGRIAAQVLTGIGFLGAGAIIHMKGSVRGLTTAAGIWMVATIGLAIGAGMYVVALIATALVLFILVSLEKYDHRRTNTSGQTRAINITFDGIVDSAAHIDDILARYGVCVQDRFIKYDYQQQISGLSLIIYTKSKMNYTPLFNDLELALPIKTITLTNDINI